MELIDRSKLEVYGATCKSQDYMDGVKDVLEYIDNLTPVDAELVRHGKWDYVTVVDGVFWRCSNCGTPSEALGAKYLYRYCPFCGAKMDGE